MKSNRAYPGHNHRRLMRQRRANGSFKVASMEQHIARYLGVNRRAIRFMLPTGHTASGNVTLDDLRGRWACQTLIEYIGLKYKGEL